MPHIPYDITREFVWWGNASNDHAHCMISFPRKQTRGVLWPSKVGVSQSFHWLIHQVMTCHMILLWFGLLLLTRGILLNIAKIFGKKSTNFKMLATEVETSDMHCFHPRPKRIRSLSGKHVEERSLDIVGVLDTLKSYEDYDGGVNCKICGKENTLSFIIMSIFVLLIAVKLRTGC